MNDKDRKNLKFILSHCQLMERHVEYFGNDREEYMDNEHYQAACGFELLELESILIDYLMISLINILILIGVDL